MIDPDAVREKAKRSYAGHYRSEAGRLFLALVSSDGGGGNPSDSEAATLKISLRPPTEHLALRDPSRARTWTDSWRKHPMSVYVQWTERHWPSIGTQAIPYRFVARGIEHIADCANKAAEWNMISSRISEFATHYAQEWTVSRSVERDAEVAKAITRVIGRLTALEDADWRITLSVIGWFSRQPSDAGAYFIRQLPIKGVHTKWMENHRSVIDPLAEAICGIRPVFAQPKSLIRIHALDQKLHIGGANEYALTTDEFDALPNMPSTVIVCENLVNTVALPPIEGVLAVFGGGHAVAELAKIPWIDEVPVLYWGDLDTNGLAILNRLRGHVRHVKSVMMDTETLDRHFDLCVEEPSPFNGDLPLLTESEASVLLKLREGDEGRGISTLRLEQERIEWEWACRQIEIGISALL